LIARQNAHNGSLSHRSKGTKSMYHVLYGNGSGTFNFPNISEAKAYARKVARRHGSAEVIETATGKCVADY
jgi:hypothetical protein